MPGVGVRRTLTLRREALNDLSTDELTAVAGGTGSVPCLPPTFIGITTGTRACPTGNCRG